MLDAKATLSLGVIDRFTLLGKVDSFRLEANQKLSSTHRADKGQYFTPRNIAQFMALFFHEQPASLRILDAGAGVGSLSAALVAQACGWETKPTQIHVTAYEMEPLLVDYLHKSMMYCQQVCLAEGVKFEYEVITDDFIDANVSSLNNGDLFAPLQKSFNAAILNPPYRKILGSSSTRQLLRRVGIETSNMYTAFLWITLKLLEPGGEMVAITPRSFCNGPYFLPFRKALLDSMSLQQIHVFEQRDQAFHEDDVLQENIILHARKGSQQGRLIVSSSSDPDDQLIVAREVSYEEVVHPDNSQLFIHIVPDELRQQLGDEVRSLPTSLDDLGISVSTGRVVDFRAIKFLRKRPDEHTAPLLYPHHASNGYVSWPAQSNKKPNAIKVAAETEALLVPRGWYVLVKRFSAKEEKRRVVAVVYDPERFEADQVGIENHLNFYHQGGHGLSPGLAKGLAAFLNSTPVDEYFRQFSGHTQVNAADLRNLKYPTEEQLLAIGETIGEAFPSQSALDDIVLERIGMTNAKTKLQIKKKIDESLEILRALNIPRAQLNQRSALTLLALAEMKPDTEWANASTPLYGITEMMDYFHNHFDVTYAPNTRETVRRQTVHQFVQLGLVIPNPDDPTRPINSPNTRYQIEASFLKVIRSFDTEEWEHNLRTYLVSADKIKRLRERERVMTLIPISMPNGSQVKISPGGQNALIKQIVEGFCPRFVPGGVIIYLGDAGKKFKIRETAYFERLGIILDEHGKMPDVVVHLEEKNWLVLIEAVTSHGPINIKRHNELKGLFKGKAPLVLVTAFPTRKIMMKYLQEIAWETEVWVADAPDHLIHFNGERFLGPYD